MNYLDDVLWCWYEVQGSGKLLPGQQHLHTGVFRSGVGCSHDIQVKTGHLFCNPSFKHLFVILFCYSVKYTFPSYLQSHFINIPTLFLSNSNARLMLKTCFDLYFWNKWWRYITLNTYFYKMTVFSWNISIW